MRRWADVKMRRCEDEKMWRWEDVKWEDVKMWRCEDEKMRYRPPLLEEPCAQTLSGKNSHVTNMGHINHITDIFKITSPTCKVAELFSPSITTTVWHGKSWNSNSISGTVKAGFNGAKTQRRGKTRKQTAAWARGNRPGGQTGPTIDRWCNIVLTTWELPMDTNGNIW